MRGDRKQGRQVAILESLRLQSNQTVEVLSKLSGYDYLGGRFSKEQTVREDLKDLLFRGEVTRVSIKNKTGGVCYLYSIREPGTVTISENPTVTVLENDSEVVEHVWSLEEVLYFLAQGEGLTPSCFDKLRHKAVTGVRAAIDARDRARKEL